MTCFFGILLGQIFLVFFSLGKQQNIALGESSKLAKHSKVVQFCCSIAFRQVVKRNSCVLVQLPKGQSPITVTRVHIALINGHSQNLPRERAAMVGLVKILRVSNLSQPNFQTLLLFIQTPLGELGVVSIWPKDSFAQKAISYLEMIKPHDMETTSVVYDWMQFQLPYWLHLLNPSITSLGCIIQHYS